LSRVAQLTLLMLSCIVVVMEGCVIDYGNRINFLEGTIETLSRELRHQQDQQLIKEANDRVQLEIRSTGT